LSAVVAAGWPIRLEGGGGAEPVGSSDMRRYVFALAGYLALSLQVGLTSVLGGWSPELSLILVVFIAVLGSARAALWAGLVIGVLVDALSPLPVAGEVRDLMVLGPHTLGYLAVVGLTLWWRDLTFEHSAWTLAGLTLVGGMVLHGVAVGLLSLRGWSVLAGDPVPGWDAWQQAKLRGVTVLVTAVCAVPLHGLLLWGRKWWGFPAERLRRVAR